MLKLNLGCADDLLPDYTNVDREEYPNWAKSERDCFVWDLGTTWPWQDSVVDFIRAYDVIEHLPYKILTMNEIWRVLKPGREVEIFVPTTDGRGAWQDPGHVSYWNRNSFFYWTVGDPHFERFKGAYGIKGGFKVTKEARWNDFNADVEKLQITLEKVA